MKFSEINASQIYFRLKEISGCENLFSKIRGFIKLKKKKHLEHFCQFLMLNIPSIKELLHKPSESQWNITGPLPGKLKKKLFWALSYKILPSEITKTREIAILWGYFGSLGTNVEFNGFLWFCEFLKVSASIFWLKTVLTLN